MRKKSKFYAVLALLALIVCATAASFGALAVDDDPPIFDVSGEIPSVVVRGSEINMPVVTATKGGVTKTATVGIYDPFGSLAALGAGSFVPAATGEYTVRYKVTFGKTYTQEAKFTVVAKTDGAFKSDGGITVETQKKTDLSMFKTQFEGVLLTASKSGATATFTQPIDLSYNTKDDPLISLLVIPSAKGTLDFDGFTVQLTDAHDEDNFVRIVNYRGSWGYNTSYVRAAANKQQLAGYESDKLLIAYNTGSPIWFSYTAEPTSGSSSGDSLLCTYSYDDAEKSVYVKNEKRSLNGARPGLVNDFDSLECQNPKLLWNGFTTGEAYLSITFDSLLNDSAQILVTSVNGTDLSGETVTDTQGPVIFVDKQGYSDAPDGLAGVPYPVFSASAYDRVDGKTEPTVLIYKDYATPDQKLVNSRVSGDFTASEAGNYTIMYTAVDISGNRSQTEVPVRIKTELEAMSASYSPSPVSTASVGEKVRIPDVNVSGGSGNKQTRVYVEFPDGTQAAPPETVAQSQLQHQHNRVAK